MTLAILVSLVALVVICNLIGWTKFVVHTNSESSQAEANCIVNLRFGGTQISWGTAKRFAERHGVKWFNPFPIRLEFWRPPSQRNMVDVFCIGCRWLAIRYTTKGETKPNGAWSDYTGLRLDGTIARETRPYGGILGALFCWLPTRMWLTESPWDGGPWFDSPAEAAEFIKSESVDDEGGQVEFTDDELRPLWMPGRKAEKKDWSITCIVIPRWRLPQEWCGW